MATLENLVLKRLIHLNDDELIEKIREVRTLRRLIISSKPKKVQKADVKKTMSSDNLINMLSPEQVAMLLGKLGKGGEDGSIEDNGQTKDSEDGGG